MWSATDCKRGLCCAPSSRQCWLSVGQYFRRNEEYKSAIDSFKAAVKLSNDPWVTVSAHLGLMAIYRNLGDTENAVLRYEAAREIYPGIDDMLKKAEIDRVKKLLRTEEFEAEFFKMLYCR